MPQTKTLPAIRPNAGAQANYEKRLTSLIEEMNNSVDYWLHAAYGQNRDEIINDNPVTVLASDESATATLKRALARLRKQWGRKFDQLAPKLARSFIKNATMPADLALAKALRDAGFTVKLQMSRRVNNVLSAAVAENVALIKSIPDQYMDRVEGAVMRSVSAGRDISSLTTELQNSYGITRRRAAFIARDQNNKASSVIQRARQIDLGLYKAIWLHSGGGHHPRPKHVAFSGQEYDVRKGAPIGDKGQYVHPGEEPGCKCQRKIVLTLSS